MINSGKFRQVEAIIFIHLEEIYWQQYGPAVTQEESALNLLNDKAVISNSVKTDGNRANNNEELWFFRYYECNQASHDAYWVRKNVFGFQSSIQNNKPWWVW